MKSYQAQVKLRHLVENKYLSVREFCDNFQIFILKSEFYAGIRNIEN
jgi:hypothetical protein